MFSRIGSIPRHLYVYVDSQYTHQDPCGFVPTVWFGLVSIPGRVWGINIMLESGAIYRNVPPHAIAFNSNPESVKWTEKDSQLWDCYGDQWSAHQYTYLRELKCSAIIGDKHYPGEYLFTVAPINDGFSEAPEQNKEFMFIKLNNGRLTVQPTNKVLIKDLSFTTGKPPKLRLQTEVWSCE